MLFILCGAAGFRIGEALGIEIDKHISPDFQTISIEQKARHCKVEERLKTPSALGKSTSIQQSPRCLKSLSVSAESGFLFRTQEWKAALDHPILSVAIFTQL